MHLQFTSRTVLICYMLKENKSVVLKEDGWKYNSTFTKKIMLDRLNYF